MAEPTLIKFSFQELAKLMVKQQGLKEGYWGIFLRFGISGANLGPTEETIVPAAIVPVLEIGLQKFEGPGPLAVDAAKIASEK